MPVLLRSSQSASQKEAVEEMKDCRSITQHWCRSTVMPERGPIICQDRTCLSVPEAARRNYFSSQTQHNFQSSESIDNQISASDDSQSSESIDTKPSASVDTLRLSEQPETEKSKSEGRTKNRKKKKKRNVDADFLPLVPLQCHEGSLEYRVRCRGGSEPFTKEPKLTSNTKPDTTACLGAWYTCQKEVNRTWWQPPLRLDSWKHGQSVSQEEAVEEMKD
ncbi:hypothetical protein F2Q68_00014335 [Brassica cretica]|uniref:Uncharacterized protein n=1 Tax=Brassica cretica TaxID=69181 RepID=A0A8S9HR17_BRACR|nr:hypothetical protein F2Q68_00014335 [Brassica cretica]